MTLFEYISVAFSIVLLLGAASLLGALRRIFAEGRRYWVHATWVVTVLFLHAVVWWSLWSFGAVESWTLPSFLLVLLQPVSLYLIASLLVGDEPATTESWRAHFFRIRRWLFAARFVYMAAVVLAAPGHRSRSSGALARLDSYGAFDFGAYFRKRAGTCGVGRSERLVDARCGWSGSRWVAL